MYEQGSGFDMSPDMVELRRKEEEYRKKQQAATGSPWGTGGGGFGQPPTSSPQQQITQALTTGAPAPAPFSSSSNPTQGVGAYLPGRAPPDVLAAAGVSGQALKDYYATAQAIPTNASGGFGGGGGFTGGGMPAAGGGQSALVPGKLMKSADLATTKTNFSPVETALAGKEIDSGQLMQSNLTGVAPPPRASMPPAPAGRSAEQIAGIKDYYTQNKGDPGKIWGAMKEYGVSTSELAQYNGMTEDQANQYLSGVNGSQPPAATSSQNLNPQGFLQELDKIQKLTDTRDLEWQAKNSSYNGDNANRDLGNAPNGYVVNPETGRFIVSVLASSTRDSQTGEEKQGAVTGYETGVNYSPNGGVTIEQYDLQGNKTGEYKSVKSGLNKEALMAFATMVTVGVASGLTASAAAAEAAASSGISVADAAAAMGGAGEFGAAQVAMAESMAAGTAAGAGVTVGAPIATGVANGVTLPALTAPVASTTGAFTSLLAPGGALSGLSTVLSSLGLSAADAAKLVATVYAGMGGGGGGSGGSGGGSGSGSGGAGVGGTAEQIAATKKYLEEILPYTRTDSSNPYGTSKWRRLPDGRWTQDTELNAPNQGLFDDSSGKLKSLLGGIDPNEKAPELITDAGGKYSEQLAKTIYDRVARNFLPAQATARRALENRLSERGMQPGNEAYIREMDRFDKQAQDQIKDAAAQAQVESAGQGLREAEFTNNSRMGNFNANQKSRTDLTNLLSKVRSDAGQGANGQPSTSSLPTGIPDTQAMNSAASAQNQIAYKNQRDADEAKNKRRNDLVNSLIKWGLG